jgi:hypothetical protein
MNVSLLGPSNMTKFSEIIGKQPKEIEAVAREIGRTLAEKQCRLVVVFNYIGILRLIGEEFKKHGGRLEMLYTENDYDWYTDLYMKHLSEADINVKKDSWHDLLLSLVTDSDIVLCAGISAGVYTELGYMKWNNQEKKGRVRKLIGIKEFLRGGEFPPEISWDMEKIITVIPASKLGQVIDEQQRQWTE